MSAEWLVSGLSELWSHKHNILKLHGTVFRITLTQNVLMYCSEGGLLWKNNRSFKGWGFLSIVLVMILLWLSSFVVEVVVVILWWLSHQSIATLDVPTTGLLTSIVIRYG